MLAAICVALVISGCNESNSQDQVLATPEQIQAISENDALFHPTVMPTHTALPEPTNTPTPQPTATPLPFFVEYRPTPSPVPIEEEYSGPEVPVIDSVVILEEEQTWSKVTKPQCEFWNGSYVTVSTRWTLAPAESKIGARWYAGDELVRDEEIEIEAREVNSRHTFTLGLGRQNTSTDKWGWWHVDIVGDGEVLTTVEFLFDSFGGPAPSNPWWPYTVKAGDTVWSIAADPSLNEGRGSRFTVKELLELNNWDNGDSLYEGQVILIPWTKSSVSCKAWPLPFDIKDHLPST